MIVRLFPSFKYVVRFLKSGCINEVFLVEMYTILADGLLVFKYVPSSFSELFFEQVILMDSPSQTLIMSVGHSIHTFSLPTNKKCNGNHNILMYIYQGNLQMMTEWQRIEEKFGFQRKIKLQWEIRKLDNVTSQEESSRRYSTTARIKKQRYKNM